MWLIFVKLRNVKAALSVGPAFFRKLFTFKCPTSKKGFVWLASFETRVDSQHKKVRDCNLIILLTTFLLFMLIVRNLIELKLGRIFRLLMQLRRKINTSHHF